jgi:FkbH-like protein
MLTGSSLMPSAVPPSAQLPVVAVSATFTAEPVRDTLEFWFEELGLPHRVEFAPYNQVFQQLLDPASLLAQNRAGFDVLLVRLEDWAKGGGLAHLQETVPQFLAGLREAAAGWHVPTLVVLCPCSPTFLASAPARALLEGMAAMARAALASLASVQLITSGELELLYPVPDGHDPHADELGHVPYTPELFAALGTLVARKVAALCRPPHKVVVLDCDETLWQGVCAEDGPFGVTLDAEHRALQEFMRAQRDAGMLLALCSKNEPEDVEDVFRANPDLPLNSDDFVARRINWQPKAENLVSLSRELGLGLDSFVFVDDNEAECAELEASCPEVLALVLPQQDVAGFLRHVWAFDRAGTTREDRERAAMYAQNLERTRLEKRTRGLAGFLEALRLEVGIAPVAPDELARVAQLTQRTNQMNATTVRRSELDLRDLLRSGAAECLSVHVRDRFGSYGLVGALLFRAAPDALAIDTFLLSCRALGKGVEHRMLARLGELAQERGKPWIEAPFVRTARNRPALDFLRAVAGEPEPRGDGSQLFRMAAATAAAIRHRPVAGSAAVDDPLGETAAGVLAVPRAGGRGALDDAHVARALREPRAILEAVRARSATVAAGPPPGEAPRTELERELLALWGDLLGSGRVGVHDSFFDLGGHSLLAVQLLSRVRQVYAVELSLELVYSARFTVAELAKAIELAQIEQAGEAEYAATLAELESLSDEAARALLERERARRHGPDGE